MLNKRITKMLLLVVLIAILACVHGSDRIVGGAPTQITEVPYQVALLYDYWGMGWYKQFCGGSIISRKVILTAAHCTQGKPASKVGIRAGSSYHNTSGQVIAVERIVEHSGFNSLLDYDVSLMFLTNELTLDSGVAVVTLPYQGETVGDGVLALVSGWGRLTESGVSSIQLNEVTVPIVNQQKCINAYANINPVTDNMICAGRLGVGGQDSCQGDSGGPMTVNGVLHGVISWGVGCAQANYPGVYARVAMFRNWIDQNV